MEMKLYNYYRSSASYRVRIALALKGVEYDYLPVHLLNSGGEQFQIDYRSLNPQSLVPTLVVGEHAIYQSLAIIEYLEETIASPPLLPDDAVARANVRAFALHLGCDVQPLVNLRVQKYLKEHVGAGQAHVSQWLSHWMSLGLKSLEKQLDKLPANDFCFGDTPGLADIFLIPQIFSAKRFNVEITPYHRLSSIYEHCLQHEAFKKAAPEVQPDSER
ncbi:maleylacetoacetate isomerase [Maricurvus nonylphenolicus]|uniref:maleylacetoacetate isomerase n=1 Tax=Maricurvus nonylphenolicus TaxID=1008307 RepID=UPI0036F2286C